MFPYLLGVFLFYFFFKGVKGQKHSAVLGGMGFSGNIASLAVPCLQSWWWCGVRAESCDSWHGQRWKTCCWGLRHLQQEGLLLPGSENFDWKRRDESKSYLSKLSFVFF